MKKSEIKLNGIYTARVSGNFVTVRVDEIAEHWNGKRTNLVYRVTNLNTGRKLLFRSAARFRAPVKMADPWFVVEEK